MNFGKIRRVLKESLSYKNKHVLYKTATSWFLKVFADLESETENDLALALERLFYKKFDQKSVLEWADLNKSLINAFNINLDDWSFNILNGIGPCITKSVNYNWKNFIILSKSSLNFDSLDFKVKKEAVFNKTDKIPVIYLYEVYSFTNEESGASTLDKNLYPYFFLLDFFKNSLPEADLNNQDIQEFIIKNKNKLNSILQFATIYPKTLGFGVDGTAFDLGNNKVLKIFKEEFAYNKALQAVDDLHKNAPNAASEIMMYDLGVMGEVGYEQIPIYYYIIEKVATVTSLDEDKFNKVHKIISAIITNIYADKATWNKFKKEKLNINDPLIAEKINDISFSVKSVYKKEIHDLTVSLNLHSEENKPEWTSMLKNKTMDDWVLLLTKEIAAKFLSGRGDMHLGNIGITNSGYLRFFDAAHIVWQDNINYLPYFTNNKVEVVNDGVTKRV